MAARRERNGQGGVILIRRDEAGPPPRHGGAWKVAYADFVTAMMAFFLLMWLLNATTEEQRKGLADYFSPANALSHNSSGTGQPFGGHTAFDQGALVSDRGAVRVLAGRRPVTPDAEEDDERPVQPSAGSVPPGDRDDASDHDHGIEHARGKDHEQAGAHDRQKGGVPDRAQHGAQDRAQDGAQDGAQDRPQERADLAASSPGAAGAQAARQSAERAAFKRAGEQIREAVSGDAGLAELARQLAIDTTPQGLRIQIMDEERRPMFATGSSMPNDRARLLLTKIAQVLRKLPEAISVAGHTDAAQYAGSGSGNWELSADRANMARKLLVEAGLPEGRIRAVTGYADRDPLLSDDPLAAGNRRIAIVVLRDSAPALAPAPARP